MPVVCFAALGSLPSVSACQQVTVRRIGPPLATLSEEFSQVSSIRELGRNRALLTDFIDNRIVLADFSRNAVTPFGRVGDGPGEYRRILPLETIGHDSTLMGSTLLRRWILITGDTTMTTLAPADPLVELVQGVTGRLGNDGDGHMLAFRSRGQRSRARQEVPYYVVLISLPSMKEDTIDRGVTVFSAMISAADAGKGMTSPAYTIGEQRVIARDGWVAIVRPSPYRVDWRAPDGHWVGGAPIPHRSVRIDRREKAAYMAFRAAALENRGRGSGSTPNTAHGNSMPPVTIDNWPEMVPAFSALGSVIPTMDGRVTVKRTPTADNPLPRYDVVNHQGVREYQVVLSDDQRILGFGSGMVYLLTTDSATGIQHVSQHRWPPR